MDVIFMTTRPIKIGIIAIIFALCGCARRDSGQESKSVPTTQQPAGRAASDTTRSVEFNPAELKISAKGTEPFWNVDVEGDTAHLQTPDEGNLYYAGGVWKQGDTSGWVYEARRKHADGEETLTLTITKQQCSDGMSDIEYPLRAVLIRDAARMEGCAIAGRSARQSPSE
jgi:uncharacterized membrane protein